MDIRADAKVGKTVTHANLRGGLRGIYAIVDSENPDLVRVAGDILAGGARIVQYRAKRGIVPADVRALRALTRKQNALMIVNDDWRAAIAFDADGVHLGPDDVVATGIGAIRASLGDRLLGLSCGTPREAREAEMHGADYIGAGAVYDTTSKFDAGDPIGLAGLRLVAAATSLPVAAIGGINADRIAEVRDTGVAMAAALSVFVDGADTRAIAAELVRRWEAAS